MDLSRLPPNVPDARGFVDAVIRTSVGGVRADGWMLAPEAEFSSVRVYVDGTRVGVSERVPRPDVADAYPAIAHAGRSGFRVHLDLGGAEADSYRVITLVGFRNDRPLARLFLILGQELPPPELRGRVAGGTDGGWFSSSGYGCAATFLDAIRRHRELGSVRRLFDWGCGCGRITAHLLHQLPAVEIQGSDIDPEAVTWCQVHLRPAKFLVNGTYPPLPFEGATFDVVLAYSIFTHLTREVQNAWLAELRRVVLPGGLVLATVHGESAARQLPAETFGRVACGDFSDESPDAALERIAPPGYYRSTFQSQKYTLGEWSKHFNILEYAPARGLGYQDLVVMRRPSERPGVA